MTTIAILLALMGSRAPVEITMAAPEVSAGATIEFEITNRLEESIFLPGCNHYLLQQRVDDHWKVVHQKACFWEGFAVEIAAGASQQFAELSEELPPGTYRVHVDYHLGCKSGEPISAAECRDQSTAVGSEFQIRAGS